MVAASIPDEIEAVADFVNRERPRVDYLIVTGGLGGTPDDLTREALAAAFGVPQVEVPELAAELRRRFPKHPDYAARWAQLPAGSRPLRNPKGGAPGFVLENVWVLPGLPAEMEAMFDAYADELRGRQPDRVVAARVPDARERHRAPARRRATVRWPNVSIGSYPRFLPDGPEVEIVLKSADPKALAAGGRLARARARVGDCVRHVVSSWAGARSRLVSRR